MPKFKVQEGYAFFIPKQLDPVLPGEEVELDNIDQFEQGWKLVPVEGEDETSTNLEDLNVKQLKSLAQQMKLELGEAKTKEELIALIEGANEGK